MEPADLISVAKGETPADLILANARVVNVFTGEIEPGNVAISGERIAGVGDYQQAEQVLDLNGKYLAPGLINGHTHLESSMLDVGQWTLEHAAELAIPTLLMHGLSDSITSAQASMDFAHQASRSCTVRTFSHLYHELHWEPERDEVFQVVLHWLEESLLA